MNEDYTAGPEINEPPPERSNRHSLQSPTLEIDVYVWRYAPIVAHARNDDDDTLFNIMAKNGDLKTSSEKKNK